MGLISLWELICPAKPSPLPWVAGAQSLSHCGVGPGVSLRGVGTGIFSSAPGRESRPGKKPGRVEERVTSQWVGNTQGLEGANETKGSEGLLFRYEQQAAGSAARGLLSLPPTAASVQNLIKAGGGDTTAPRPSFGGHKWRLEARGVGVRGTKLPAKLDLTRAPANR